MRSFASFFEDVPDPRSEAHIDHPLEVILAIVVLALACGAEGWEDMALWAECKQAWLRTWLDLSHGVPSADTLRRVFSALLPGPLRKALTAWMQQVVELGQDKLGLVAFDGKTVRGSRRASLDLPAVHIVRAWVRHNGLVLGQLATDAKSNEITAIPQLLELLALRGALVSIDAMGTQKDIAQKILARQADYLLAVKDNQPSLHDAVRDALEGATPAARTTPTFCRTHDRAHGRDEQRLVWVTHRAADLARCTDWPQVRTVARVDALVDRGDKVTAESRYFISSRALTARELADAVRGHWGIENRCHWVLDVVFREDQSRIYQGYAAENLSLLRSGVLNALRADTTRKLSVRQKQKLCGWDPAYLFTIAKGLVF